MIKKIVTFNLQIMREDDSEEWVECHVDPDMDPGQWMRINIPGWVHLRKEDLAIMHIGTEIEHIKPGGQ